MTLIKYVQTYKYKEPVPVEYEFHSIVNDKIQLINVESGTIVRVSCKGLLNKYVLKEDK